MANAIRLPQRSGRTLNVVLTKDQFQRYRDTCLPLLSDMLTSVFPPSRNANTEDASHDEERAHTPHQLPTREGDHLAQEQLMLPLRNPAARLNSEGSDAGGMFKWLFGRTQKGPFPPSPQGSQVDFWDIYCCINRTYTEPLETILRHIETNGLDDERFFVALNKEIGRAAGNWFWGTLRRVCSWKRCCGITFVEVFTMAPAFEYSNEHLEYFKNLA